MTMNRRHALMTGSALAVGATVNRSAGVIAGQSGRPQIAAVYSHIPSTAASNVAAMAAECAAACAICIDATTERLIAGDHAFAELLALCRDCSDICSVTATLLARRGPLAPAICQACADACSRLAAVCPEFTDAADVRMCRTVAARCAHGCRSLIG